MLFLFLSATIYSRYCSAGAVVQGTDVRFDPIRASAQLVPRYNVRSDLIRSNPIKSGPIRSSARLALITHTLCIPGLRIFDSDTPPLPRSLFFITLLSRRHFLSAAGHGHEPPVLADTLSPGDPESSRWFIAASLYSFDRSVGTWVRIREIG